MVVRAGQMVSCIGRQHPDGTIEGINGGRLGMVVAGDVSADEMLTHAEDQVKIVGTVVHIGAAAASFVAYRIILQPLVSIPGFVPGLEGMLGLGANMVALPSALATTALTILAGWLSARMPYDFLKTAVSLLYLFAVWSSVGGAVGFASRRTMAAGQLAAGQAVSLNRWLGGQLRSLLGSRRN
jgi:NAD/NADP transhydrogenase beta subunit